MEQLTNLEQLFDFRFLDRVATYSVLDVLAALIVSMGVGLFILFIYAKTFKGVMYSRSFAISLLAMNLITTLVILAVSSHFIIAFGMIGALSIVRFRTVVKEPLDLVYLFWSITTGIIVGAGFVVMATVGSLFIGIILYVLINRKPNDIPYIVVISCDSDTAEGQVIAIIKKYTKRHVLKAKTVSRDGVEVTVEVRLIENQSNFINKLLVVEGVHNATLVSYNGDYYM
jgi:hypothetical protein